MAGSGFSKTIPLSQTTKFIVDNRGRTAPTAEVGIPLIGLKLFYYRVYPLQWDSTSKTWESFAPEPSLVTCVSEPEAAQIEGFDVVCYSMQTSPECSPLSCNDLCESVAVNEHCLFPSLEDAKQALESGIFEGGERGPYRILEVCSL